MRVHAVKARWFEAAALSIGALFLLSGCASNPTVPPVKKVASVPKRALSKTAYATPVETANHSLDAAPITMDTEERPTHVQIGKASFYARKFQGHRTASGERYDMHALTAAHRTLPLGSYVRVSNVSKTKSVVVRINDRGPFVEGRVIDLSYAAAAAIGLQRMGSASVMIEPATKDSMRIASITPIGRPRKARKKKRH